MSRVIVIQFISLDGVTQDPDGSDGTAQGGWAFRHGPEAVAGDKFELGELLESGTLLLGRRTWQLFSQIWPTRSDDFAKKMNAMPKLVVSRSVTRADAWANSTVLGGDLIQEVTRRKQDQDLIVVGSTSVIRTLMTRDLIDEYRLLVFPVVLGQGERLFGDAGATDLHLVSAGTRGPTALLTYSRPCH